MENYDLYILADILISGTIYEKLGINKFCLA